MCFCTLSFVNKMGNRWWFFIFYLIHILDPTYCFVIKAVHILRHWLLASADRYTWHWTRMLMSLEYIGPMEIWLKCWIYNFTKEFYNDYPSNVFSISSELPSGKCHWAKLMSQHWFRLEMPHGVTRRQWDKVTTRSSLIGTWETWMLF